MIVKNIIISLTVFIIGVFAVNTQANTVTCSVDIGRAYQEAKKYGWKFECGNSLHGTSGITFDSKKRVGCFGKANAYATWNQFTGGFFRKGSTGTRYLSNQWKVHAFEISGGSHKSYQPAAGARVRFSWETKTPGSTTRRFLYRIKLKKDRIDKDE